MYYNNITRELSFDINNMKLDNARVDIYDTLGNRVASINVQADVKTYSFYDLSAGVYFVVVKSPDIHFTGKFTVQ